MIEQSMTLAVSDQVWTTLIVAFFTMMTAIISAITAVYTAQGKNLAVQAADASKTAVVVAKETASVAKQGVELAKENAEVNKEIHTLVNSNFTKQGERFDAAILQVRTELKEAMEKNQQLVERMMMTKDSEQPQEVILAAGSQVQMIPPEVGT